LEVFGHLHPFDLLRLARTTKQFRRLLMHRSSISVWKAARSNVHGAFPGPPSDMSEPEWANLSFDPHCHFCFTSNIRNVEWRLRVRVCSKCAKEHVRETCGRVSSAYLNDLDNASNSNSASDSDSNLDSDSDSDSDAGSEFAFLEEMFGRKSEPREREPHYERMIPTKSTMKGLIRSFLVRDYEDVRQRYLELKDPDARTDFVAERKGEVRKVIEHSRLCERWARKEAQHRSEELQKMKDERKSAIVEKLKELGYEKDLESIEYPDSLDDLKLVKQPQRLTERIWKNIQGPIIEFMEAMRAKRLAREFANLIRARKKTAIAILHTFSASQFNEIMPRPTDFYSLAPIKAILDQPADVNVDESSFAHVIPLLPVIIDKWRKDMDPDLRKYLLAIRNGEDDSMSSSDDDSTSSDDSSSSSDDSALSSDDFSSD